MISFCLSSSAPLHGWGTETMGGKAEYAIKKNSANEKCYKVPGAKVFVSFFKKSWLLLENAANPKRCLP